MRKTLGLTMLALTAAVTAPAVPAHASGARYCEAIGTIEFSPPLTALIGGGSMSVDYSYLCYGVDDSGASGLQSGSFSLSYTYFGSCVSATLHESSGLVDGVLVGGTAGVTVNTTSRYGVRVWALVPNLPSTPCNLASATFANTGPDVIV